MPDWIDRRDATLAQRQAQVRAYLERSKELSDAREREERNRERPASRSRFQPGTRKLPDLTDEELREALGKASPDQPRHLEYPHLLILRERGFIRMTYADTGAGEFGVPSFRGDVITKVGKEWLFQIK